MKKFFNNETIESKLRRYFVALTLIIIAVLWVFQGFFLDSFYRYTKSQKITKLAHRIEASYLSGSLEDFTQEALNTESHVQLINRNGVVMVDTVGVPTPQVQIQNAKVYQYIFGSLNTGDGKVIDVNTIDNASRVPTSRLSYALKLDNNVLLFIQTDMVPVSATVETIQFQLMVVTAIVVIIAVVLSRRLAKNVSLPMVDITLGAQRIAKGDYETVVVGEGYQEIETLSQTLNTMRQDLNRVETMRNELLANVSHDLRTPLTMIQGYLELMKDFPEEMNHDNLNVISQESARLKDMIQNLLDLSRIQTGIQDIRNETFEAYTWLKDNEKRYQELFKERNIYFNIEPSKVTADKTMIQQALDNLIQNALKHTHGAIYVTGLVQGEGYEVSVKDEGPGIQTENQESIWERYYSTDIDYKREDHGYGLGLSIVKKIFESHRIEYGYRNNEPHGSIFYFKLNRS